MNLGIRNCQVNVLMSSFIPSHFALGYHEYVKNFVKVFNFKMLDKSIAHIEVIII